jgi:hypothetical protein
MPKAYLTPTSGVGAFPHVRHAVTPAVQGRTCRCAQGVRGQCSPVGPPDDARAAAGSDLALTRLRTAPRTPLRGQAPRCLQQQQALPGLPACEEYCTQYRISHPTYGTPRRMFRQAARKVRFEAAVKPGITMCRRRSSPTCATTRGRRCGGGCGASTAGPRGRRSATATVAADCGRPAENGHCSTPRRWARPATATGARSSRLPGPSRRITLPDRGLWRARRIERCTPGSGSGPGKRTGRKAGTAPRADFTDPRLPRS